MSATKNQSKREAKPKGPSETQEHHEEDADFDPDDPCIKREEVIVEPKKHIIRAVGEDPRFQQQNQTLRCYVSYTDFFRCEKILGEGHEACGWFKEVYQTFCPLNWIKRFDEAREEGRFPWHRRDQGPFPGERYG